MTGAVQDHGLAGVVVTTEEPVPHPVLARAFAALDRAEVRWALLRGAEDLARPSGDVDLLVDASAMPSLDGALASAGFRRLGVRGHGSHRFSFCFDVDDDLWLKLDVVSAVDFGAHQQLRSSLAAGCLDRRVRAGTLWRLREDDEAWLVLLHLFLDKGRVDPGRRDLARAAATRASRDAVVADALDRYAGRGAADQVLRAVGDLGRAEGDASGAARDLRLRWSRRRPLGVAATYVRTWAVRRLALPVRGHPGGLVVAVLGPDGAGKSTLTAALSARFPVPTRTVYMGLWQAGRWDRPGRHLAAVRVAQRIGRVLVSSATVRFHRRRGRLVLLDRAPQDALLSGTPAPGLVGRLVSSLSLRLGPRPDLALVLDAPGEVMFARKGEHSVEALEARRQGYLRLAPQFRRSAVLDAAAPVDEVSGAATAAIWQLYAPTDPAGGAAGAGGCPPQGSL